ncbi:MAG: hypothetical protein HY678_06025, partial [Chloroflexi bacterium]|nr:hypothetical protein [Chloroflexota bacterium]
VRLRAQPSGIEVQIGRGPYRVPGMAMSKSVTRAGGAQFDLSNTVEELKDGTFLGVHIPMPVHKDHNPRARNAEWQVLSRQAEDVAATVGLCLRQRRPLQKVAEYIRPLEYRKGYPQALFDLRGWPGHKASVSKRSTDAVRRSLGRVLDSDVRPNLLTALRWLEQSKEHRNGADRLVALWIALEALMAPSKDGRELVRKTAVHLAAKHYRLGMTADQIVPALGLDKMRQSRNDIVHRGARPEPTFSPNREDRDFPQMLDDIVTEVLRYKLGAGPTTAVSDHVRRWTSSRTPRSIDSLPKRTA